MSRYLDLKRAVENEEEFDVIDLMDVETYHPPHKSAGCSPYDALISHENKPSPEQIKQFLKEHNVKYERVWSISENDDPRLEGDYLTTITLQQWKNTSPPPRERGASEHKILYQDK